MMPATAHENDGDGVLRVLSSMATSAALAALAPIYTERTGVQVAIEASGGVDALRRVAAGEAVDIVVLASAAIEELERASRVLPGSRTGIARSSIVIAVPRGAAHPDIASEQAVRDAVQRGGRIGYSTGPSGTHLLQLLDRWRVRDAVAPRLVLAPPGVGVGTLIARGDVDLGFQQRSELIRAPGAEIVGPLPPEIQDVTVFVAAVVTASPRLAAAAALIAWLASPETGAVKRRHGLESCAAP